MKDTTTAAAKASLNSTHFNTLLESLEKSLAGDAAEAAEAPTQVQQMRRIKSLLLPSLSTLLFAMSCEEKRDIRLSRVYRLFKIIVHLTGANSQMKNDTELNLLVMNLIAFCDSKIPEDDHHFRNNLHQYYQRFFGDHDALKSAAVYERLCACIAQSLLCRDRKFGEMWTENAIQNIEDELKKIRNHTSHLENRIRRVEQGMKILISWLLDSRYAKSYYSKARNLLRHQELCSSLIECIDCGQFGDSSTSDRICFSLVLIHSQLMRIVKQQQQSRCLPNLEATNARVSRRIYDQIIISRKLLDKMLQMSGETVRGFYFNLLVEFMILINNSSAESEDNRGDELEEMNITMLREILGRHLYRMVEERLCKNFCRLIASQLEKRYSFCTAMWAKAEEESIRDFEQFTKAYSDCETFNGTFLNFFRQVELLRLKKELRTTVVIGSKMKKSNGGDDRPKKSKYSASCVGTNSNYDIYSSQNSNDEDDWLQKLDSISSCDSSRSHSSRSEGSSYHFEFFDTADLHLDSLRSSERMYFKKCLKFIEIDHLEADECLNDLLSLKTTGLESRNEPERAEPAKKYINRIELEREA